MRELMPRPPYVYYITINYAFREASLWSVVSCELTEYFTLWFHANRLKI